MIFNGIITFFVNSLSFIIGLLPNADPAVVNGLSSNFTTWRNTIANLNYVIPIDTFFTLVSFVIVCELAIFAWKGIRYVAGALTLGALK